MNMSKQMQKNLGWVIVGAILLFLLFKSKSCSSSFIASSNLDINNDTGNPLEACTFQCKTFTSHNDSKFIPCVNECQSWVKEESILTAGHVYRYYDRLRSRLPLQPFYKY